ncbi:MAG: hypothetical protein OEM22_08865, partial [Acidimicrobiia bacterium]|nr:hypothetical protein [Acidimicrobiia bacterium]
ATEASTTIPIAPPPVAGGGAAPPEIDDGGVTFGVAAGVVGAILVLAGAGLALYSRRARVGHVNLPRYASGKGDASAE